MPSLFKPYFISLCLIYLINKYCQSYFSNDTIIELFLKNHLNDLLFMPIVMSLILALTRFIKRDPKLLFTVFLIAFMTLFFIIIFELIGPIFYTHAIGDWIDVLMYILGAFIYLIIQTRTVTN